MEFKPLPEQAEIIDSQNKNLLVSASAGSGKTTVDCANLQTNRKRSCYSKKFACYDIHNKCRK